MTVEQHLAGDGEPVVFAACFGDDEGFALGAEAAQVAGGLAKECAFAKEQHGFQLTRGEDQQGAPSEAHKATTPRGNDWIEAALEGECVKLRGIG
jgi:hypothetical protein